jgi:hypothetical protein
MIGLADGTLPNFRTGTVSSDSPVGLTAVYYDNSHEINSEQVRNADCLIMRYITMQYKVKIVRGHYTSLTEARSMPALDWFEVISALWAGEQIIVNDSNAQDWMLLVSKGTLINQMDAFANSPTYRNGAINDSTVREVGPTNITLPVQMLNCIPK